MKRISKDQVKIWTPDEFDHDEYEPLLTGEEYNEPVVLELTRPVLVLEVETTELSINPPTGGQMLEARTGTGKLKTRSEKYFAQCCNVPISVIQALHARDVNRIGDVVANFTQ